MKDARDYLFARKEKSFDSYSVPTLEELKHLLEAVIDNGEYTFIDEGYLPITCTLADKIYSRYSAEGNGGLRAFDEELQKWLMQYNWFISTHLEVPSRLALFAIKE